MNVNHVHLLVMTNETPTRLSRWMASAGIKDEQMAATVRCDRSMITRLRLGTATPSLALAARIREATGGAVTADDFLPPFSDPASAGAPAEAAE